MAAVLPIIASGLGIANGVKGLTGGQQGGSKSSNTYVPTGLGGADQTWQGNNAALSQYLTQMGGMAPDIMGAYNKMKGIDPSQMLQIAQWNRMNNLASGNLAQANAGTFGRWAGQNENLANYADNAGFNIWNTALDPQGALKAKLQQQMTDAARANASAMGLGTSGVGANTVNQATQDFLTNWENQQLQRQAVGLSGLNQALTQGRDYMGQAAQDVLAGQQLQGSVAGYDTAAALDPMQIQMAAYGIPITAANAAGGALGQNIINPYLAQMGSIIPYLNSGQGATNQLFGQQQTSLNNLTSALNAFPNQWSQLSMAFATPSNGSGNNPGYSTDWTNSYGYTPGY